MNVTQISIGRFHHFHLARQLEKHHVLDTLYTGYPRFKLKDEQGIPPEKIHTFPWLHGPYMMLGRFGLDKWQWLAREWAWQATDSLDRYVAGRIKENTTLVALSGSGQHAGKVTQQKGGKYVCDRGSSHIRYQNEVLKEEYARWKYLFRKLTPGQLQKKKRNMNWQIG